MVRTKLFRDSIHRVLGALLVARQRCHCLITVKASTATFIQYGEVPHRFSFGVVDAKSFWATYGQDIGMNVGLSTVTGVSAIATSATGALIQTGAVASGDEVLEELIKDVPAMMGSIKKWGVSPATLFYTDDLDDTRILTEWSIVQHEKLFR